MGTDILTKFSVLCSVGGSFYPCFYSVHSTDTAVTGRQEGGLQDAGVEALHLLLSHLLRGRDTYGIGKEQKEALLKTLRRGRDRFVAVTEPAEK